MKNLTFKALLILLLPLTGCNSITDISTTDPVPHSQIIGKCFKLTHDVKLVNVNHLKRNMLVDIDESNAATAPTVSRGTKLTVIRVELYTTPPGLAMDFTVAQINDGQFNGTIVTTNRIGLTYTATHHPQVESCSETPSRGQATADNQWVPFPIPAETITIRESRDGSSTIDAATFSQSTQLFKYLSDRLKRHVEKNIILIVADKASKGPNDLYNLMETFSIEQNVNLFVILPTGKETPEGLILQCVTATETKTNR